MALDILVMNELRGLMRTIITDMLQDSALSGLKKLVAPDLEDMLEKALKKAVKDLKKEKAGELLQRFRNSIKVKKGLEAFHDRGELFNMDVLAELFEPTVGKATAHATARETFKNLAELVAGKQEIANEVLHIYADQILKKLNEHDRRVIEDHGKQSGEHKQLERKIDVLTKIIKKGARIDLKTLRDRYLDKMSVECASLPFLQFMDTAFASVESKDSVQLVRIYTELDITEMKNVEKIHDLEQHYRHIEDQKRLSLLELVKNEERVLVLGDPGSGKSTFVNYVSYVLCRANISGESTANWMKYLKDWRRPLFPVLITLREWGEKLTGKTGSAQLCLAYLKQKLNDCNAGDFWPELEHLIWDKDAGQKMVFFFDGLDEVPEGMRKTVVNSVNDMVKFYPQHKYVVSARPYAYIGQNMLLKGFRQVTLAPFNREQRDFYISAWYDELVRLKRITATSAEKSARKLRDAIPQRSLEKLAGRPLLLGVITLLHSMSNQQLPEKLEEILDETVKLLLDRWQRKREDDPGLLEILNKSGKSGLEMDDIRDCISRVAYEAHAKQTGEEITANIAEGDLKVRIEETLDFSPDQAKILIDYIRDRAGLLIWRDQHTLTFPHRLFQEFLAACYVISEVRGEEKTEFSGLASDLVRRDITLWRQVFLLAVSRAARQRRIPSALDAVNRICPGDGSQSGKMDQKTYRLAVLGGEALLEIGEHKVASDTIGRRLKNSLAGKGGVLVIAVTDDQILEPAERAAAGCVLSKLGDPRRGVGVKNDLPDILWCEIPPGVFQIGEGENGHPVELDIFYMSRFPVTNTQFDMFVKDGGYADESLWPEAKDAERWKDGSFKGRYDENRRSGPYDYGEPFSLANHPVVGISWYEALAFCRWLDGKYKSLKKIHLWQAGKIVKQPVNPGLRIILPSEAEWEKAARGGLQAYYPWGDKIDPNNANYDQTGIQATTTVGCFPAGENRFGLLDMSGNVWEWTRSHYKEYPYKTADGREKLSAGDNVTRVVRGGSYLGDAGSCRCAVRYGDYPDSRYRVDGFRVVLSPVFPSVL